MLRRSAILQMLCFVRAVVCVLAGNTASIGCPLLVPLWRGTPHQCRFYIDACGFDHAQLWASTGGPQIDILPFFKLLDA